MKRLTLIVAALALTLSACAQDHTIGADLKGGSSKVSPTATPTKTRKATPKKSATPTPTKTKATAPAYTPNKFTIVIRGSAESYVPRELTVYVGDLVTFTNLDPAAAHSWSGGPSSQQPGPWKSPILKANQSWTWKVDAAPGQYQFHDDNIPYVVGGPLTVRARP